MEEKTIKFLKDFDKYYTIDYLINLTEDVSKAFASCDINNYLGDRVTDSAYNKGCDYLNSLPIGKKIQIMLSRSKNKSTLMNSSVYKEIFNKYRKVIISGFREIYTSLFECVSDKREEVRIAINELDKLKLAEFEAIAEWIILIYLSNNGLYVNFNKTVSSNSIKKFFETKQLFILDYGAEAWLALEIISINNYLYNAKNYNDSCWNNFKSVKRFNKSRKYLDILFSRVD